MKTAVKLLSLVLALNCASLAVAGQYSFSRVFAGPVSSVNSMGIALNDNGLVALFNGTSLITTSGQTSTVIAGLSQLGGSSNIYPQLFSINNNGFVTFHAATDWQHWKILSSNGTTTYTIAADSPTSPPPNLRSSGAATINDQGTVAYFAFSPVYGIYRGDGVAAAQLVHAGSGVGAAINNAGTVAFFDDGVNAVTIVAGAQTYTLPTSIIPGTSWPDVDINDSGTTAFLASVAGTHKVGLWNGTSPPTYIDGSQYLGGLGSGWAYDIVGSADCAINNQGLVAFYAYPAVHSHDISDANTGGIFTGPDPLADKVIQKGDVLDGATVSTVTFSRGGLNNMGQIAFTATLSDGTQGVWMATPVPEPSMLALLAVGAASVLGYSWRPGRKQPVAISAFAGVISPRRCPRAP
jgi:hypothetical protein